MTKKYENPMLQVVSINKSDIIVTSPVVEVSTNAYDPTKGGIYAPGQRGLDDWYEGY